ncbi:hypothetical protein [Clostridium perfringens]
MIAELYGKISSRGTNLSESLEDNLTGDFFGTLRYIPFSKGIKPILLKVIEEENFDEYETEEWAENIEFWPYHKEGELDSIINLNLVTIGIEVKYKSGLSSDDEVSNYNEKIEKNNNQEESNNQLARESRIVNEIAKEKGKKPILLFIAKKNKGKEIINDVVKRNIIEKGVILKFISWEDICLILEELNKDIELNYFEKIVIEDLYKLLVKKGFNSFKGFKNEVNNNLVNKDEFYLFEVNNKDDLSFKDNKFEFIDDVEIDKGGYYEFL